jgi:hypothetical protein
MPSAHKRRSGKTGNKKRGGDPRATFVRMGMVGSSATDEFVRSDLQLRPPSGIYTATPPKQITSRITWIRCSTQAVITTSTTVFTETNTSFTANPFLTQYSSWLGLFDQYFLDHVVITIANNSPEGGTAAIPQVFMAIDFDSVQALGSIAAISAYANCHVSTLAPGNSVTRVVRPCNASYLGGSTNSGVNRSWVDTIYNNVPFYGFRSIANNTASATVQLDYTYAYVWALRNSI